MAHKLLFELRPSLINGFLPLLFKYLGTTAKAGFAFLILAAGARFFGIVTYEYQTIVIAAIGLAIGLAILAWLIRFLILPSLQYRFYEDHIEVEQKLLRIQKRTVRYDQITNISTDISLWDRLCNAGDIILHTAEHAEAGDIKLLYIKNPLEIEKKIHSTISMKKKEK